MKCILSRLYGILSVLINTNFALQLYENDVTEHSVLARVKLPPLDLGENEYFLCVRENNTGRFYRNKKVINRISEQHE
jgi:hypothetical protein